MAVTNTFAEWIEALIAGDGKRKLSPAQIAAFAEVSQSSIVNWRRGGRPKPESVRKLARALGVNEAHLLDISGYGPGSDSSIRSRGEPENDLAVVTVAPADADEVRWYAALPSELKRLARRMLQPLAAEWRDVRVAHLAEQEPANEDAKDTQPGVEQQDTPAQADGPPPA